MSRSGRLLLVFALLLLAVAARQSAQAQPLGSCSTRQPRLGDLLPFIAGQGNVELIVPPGAPASGFLGASGFWGSACPSSTIPAFSVVEGTGRTGDQTINNSITINFIAGQGPSFTDPNGNPVTVLANYDDVTNSLNYYELDETGQRMDWGSARGIRILSHELGHALGLGHDDCFGGASIMHTPATSIVHPSECQMADFLTCDASVRTCPEDPSCAGQCGFDPIGGLGALCQRLPFLCNHNSGFFNPWWDVDNNSSSPIYSCESSYSEVFFPGFGLVGYMTVRCGFRFSPVFGEIGQVGGAGGFIQVGPAVAFTSPTDSQTVSGLITVSGSATQAPFGVQAVATWADGQPIDLASFVYGAPVSGACNGVNDPHCPNVGFSGTLDTRTLGNGTHTITIVAVDGRTNYPTATRKDVLINVQNCLDTTPPSVSWTTPTGGSTVVGQTALKANAADNVGVTNVEFYLDNVRLGSDPTSPYAWTWDAASATAGSHQLKAKAYDACGNVATSNPVSVNVVLDTGLPAVSIIAPSAGTKLRGTTTVQATASDNTGIARVEFYLDGSFLGTDSTVPYSLSWNTASVSAGAHTLLAKAFDTSGNLGTSAPVSVIVDNTAPNLAIDVPAPSGSVSGTAAQLAGWATDANRVATLAFQLDGAALTLNAPYTYGFSRADVCSVVPTGDPNCPNVGWGAAFDSTRVTAGSHTLTVTATDSVGNTFSLQRSFTIALSVPVAPSGLSATGQSTTSVVLAWIDNSANETSFEVQRRTLPSGTFAAIATLAANVAAYTDATGAAGTSYEYRVAAKNAAGSAFSNTASANTTPAAPSGLAATYNPTSRQFTLTWIDNSGNEQGFVGQFSYSGSAFSDMTPSVGANVTSYTSGANPPIGSYQFRVRAYVGSANSAYSNTASLLVVNPTNGPGYLGCYTDATTRALPVQLPGASNTIESCKQAAFNAHYKYAGLQYYGQCYAGNTVGYTLVADSECNTPCTANALQACGGGWHNSVYATGYVPPVTTSIAWIQTAEASWGTPGTLTAAGYAANGTGGVTLVWRERSSAGVWGTWVTAPYAAPPSPDTTWSNTISSGNPTNKCHWFDAYTVYSGVTSATFHYTGTTGCP
ncbi:MAG TPA: Ig-like domain-containing protein [Thermoanaerobaculia bacterium]|jgi:hypothetical protein|nr:Ig-like domain-containing protein [Thermoanaerobaculia bacterium]